jgi:hypothetical protein
MFADGPDQGRAGVRATLDPFVSSAVETRAAPSAAEARLGKSVTPNNRISTSLDAGGPSTALGMSGVRV